MTQTVFDNAMTAHVWAQNTQPHGRSHNGNLYFEGRTLYSYGRHFPLGYIAEGAASGPLYLISTTPSSKTTNGTHRPAAWRAINYGQGAFANHAGVNCLDELRHTFERLRCGAATRKEAQAALARDMEYQRDNWPGIDAAARIYQAAGMTPQAAQAKAEAGAKRVERKARNKAAAAAKRELDQNARLARYVAGSMTPEAAAAEARDTLRDGQNGGRWQQERKEQEAAEQAREYHRAAKAAKAKGWAAIARKCRALHKAARAEIRAYEANAARWQARAAVRAAVAELRAMPDTLRDVAQPSRYARGGDYDQNPAAKAARSDAIARAYGELIEAAQTVTRSAWAGALGVAGLGRLHKFTGQLQTLKTQAESMSAGFKQEAQAATRAAWLAGDNVSLWGLPGGRLHV